MNEKKSEQFASQTMSKVHRVNDLCAGFFLYFFSLCRQLRTKVKFFCTLFDVRNAQRGFVICLISERMTKMKQEEEEDEEKTMSRAFCIIWCTHFGINLTTLIEMLCIGHTWMGLCHLFSNLKTY